MATILDIPFDQKFPFRLNYKGELSNQIGNILGPNLLGERLEVIAQVYDPKTKMTQLGLGIYRGHAS